MVEKIFGEHTPVQGSTRTAAAGELDEKRRFHRNRVKTSDTAHVRLVQRYVSRVSSCCLEAMLTGGIEVRDYEIGWANTGNVSQLLSSLALYPFTHLQG